MASDHDGSYAVTVVSQTDATPVLTEPDTPNAVAPLATAYRCYHIQLPTLV